MNRYEYFNGISMNNQPKYVIRRAVAFAILGLSAIWAFLQVYRMFVYFCWEVGIR